MGGPCLHDQVMGFPHPLRPLVGQDVCRRRFIGHAAHEPALDASLGDYVDKRHFFGDAHRLVAVRQWVAEDQQAGLGCLAGKNAEHDRGCRDHAGRRLVMLVEHDAEADLVARTPQVEITVIQIMGDLGVAMLVRQIDADRPVGAFVGQVRIAIFGKPPGFHRVAPFVSSLRI